MKSNGMKSNGMKSNGMKSNGMKSNGMKGNISTYIIIGVIILIVAIILWVVITKLSENISVKHHTGKSVEMSVETWYEIIGDNSGSGINTVPLFKYVKIISNTQFANNYSIKDLSQISIDKDKFNKTNDINIDDLKNKNNSYRLINETEIDKRGLDSVCFNTFGVISLPTTGSNKTVQDISNKINLFLSQNIFESPTIGWWEWSKIQKCD